MTDTDFFLAGGVLHITPQGDTHKVYPYPIPEPSTVLGLIAVGLSSIVGFKGKKEPK
jgi:CRISPR/Cas system-associated protein Cas5 (RAMP superfamily)